LLTHTRTVFACFLSNTSLGLRPKNVKLWVIQSPPLNLCLFDYICRLFGRETLVFEPRMAVSLRSHSFDPNGSAQGSGSTSAMKSFSVGILSSAFKITVLDQRIECS
jgi:hypothetical protein